METWVIGFRVYGQGLPFRVLGLGSRACALWIWVQGCGMLRAFRIYRAEGSGM